MGDALGGLHRKLISERFLRDLADTRLNLKTPMAKAEKDDDRLDPKMLEEIQKRLTAGEHLWRILDDYPLTVEQRLRLLQIFDSQQWD